MSTLTLTFDLPEEKYEAMIAVNAMDWALVIQDLCYEKIRNKLKHGLDGLDAKTLEKVRDWISELLEERNLSLDMIVW